VLAHMLPSPSCALQHRGLRNGPTEGATFLRKQIYMSSAPIRAMFVFWVGGPGSWFGDRIRAGDSDLQSTSWRPKVNSLV